MNTKQFKQLIKDAVVEAIYDEMPGIIVEVLKQNKQQLNEDISFSSKDVLPTDVRNQFASKLGAEFGFKQPQKELKVINAVSETGEKINPFAAFIMDAAENMTPQDKQGLRNLD